MPLALRCGISYEEFLHSTPVVINERIKAYQEAMEHEHDMNDLLAWRIGYYVCASIHDPKHYPQNPEFIGKLSKQEQTTEINELQAVAEMRAYAHALKKQGKEETLVI